MRVSFGRPAAERAAIETTYEDRATVTRTWPETGTDCITRQVERVVHAGVPCGLSQAGVGGSGQTAAQNRVECDAVLFLAPEYGLEPGDRVEVRRFGAVLDFEVTGRPSLFATHQEATLKERGMA